MPPNSPRLFDHLRESLHSKNYGLSTEKLYVYWNRFFIHWFGLRHPKDMGALEVVSFLTMLATEHMVPPSTHRQALSVILHM